MSDKELKKNIKKMAGSGYIQEDLKVKVGSFSLSGLTDEKEEN